MQAWKQFQTATVGEIIDKSMEVEDVNEVVRMVQIGLLCTQECPNLRPTMASVVQMLRHKNLELPIPTQPPFVDEAVTLASPSLNPHQHSISIDSCKYYDTDNDQR